MKRKFKLLTSIASLCLAIALMVGGVFAATAPTVSVTGSVSFKATDHVFASIQLQEEDGEYGTAQKTYDEDDVPEADEDKDYLLTLSGDLALGATDNTYWYQVKITNDSAVNGLTVTPDAFPTVPAEYQAFVTFTFYKDGQPITAPGSAALTAVGATNAVTVVEYKMQVSVEENINSKDIAALPLDWGFSLVVPA